MIRNIIQSPAEILHHPSRPLTPGMIIGSLFGDLIDTRIRANGAGLSAIQIGVPFRVVCVDPKRFHGFKILVNPEIISFEGPTVESSEGCLSIAFGNRRFKVARRAIINVRFFDRTGTKNVTMTKIDGFASFMIQHEIDHLDGKLITDNAITM